MQNKVAVDPIPFSFDATPAATNHLSTFRISTSVTIAGIRKMFSTFWTQILMGADIFFACVPKFLKT